MNDGTEMEVEKSFSLCKRLKAYSAKINWTVFILICLFTMGSWIDTYGIWSQLPIITHKLDEKLTLNSKLTVITQIGQLGPFLFILGHSCAPKTCSFSRVSYLILLVGALSCFLLAFLWDQQLEIQGQKYSIALYLLNFCLSLLDGTSTVVFLPFICENYIREYIIPNYIGESLAAFVPGLLSLIQNLNNEFSHSSSIMTSCSSSSASSSLSFDHHQNQNSSSLSLPPPQEPLFSVSTFFLLMSLLLMTSTLAFYLLLNLSSSKFERQKAAEQKLKCSLLNDNSIDEDSLQISSSSSSSSSSSPKKAANDVYNNAVVVDSSSTTLISTLKKRCHILKSQQRRETAEKVFLLTIVFIVSCLGYGILPALQSYSVLPYGSYAYNLAINLSQFLFVNLF